MLAMPDVLFLKEASSGRRNTPEKCVQESFFPVSGAALPHFCFIFPVSFETQEKQWSAPLRPMKYNWIWKFGLVLHKPFNAALHWFHIHFLWQGTNSAHRRTNVIQDILTHLPHHPSTANTFFRKGPQDVPHPWSRFDCNGTGHRSNRPRSVKAAQKLPFTIVLL